ncbi:MAG: twin-arginine translocation signal domain-containing protein, partial [Actinobacteria bacterium]|nr:twin-arginine translocation signal domain-containing protein [Actinomycetota bacterium]
MVTRRQVLKGGVVVGAAAAIGGPYLLRSSSRAAAAAIDPGSIPKYVTPLFVIPPMPPVSTSDGFDLFNVAERRIAQQVLPAGMPKTLVNGYGAPGNNGSFHSPGFAIENKVNRQTRVTWINQLVDNRGNFLPHLLTVDPTIHWANPPGGVDGRDSTPTFSSTPAPYVGPQPMVVHLHGTHDFEESDGLPETWFLPLAKDIPKGFATVGTDYNAFKQEAKDRWGVNWDPGTLTSVYPNDQRATMLMYHDHVLGMTRLDVYTGLVGPYFITGGDADLPAGTVPGPRPQLGDPPGTRYYDIAMILQDKSFNADGSLFFPDHSDLHGVPDGGFIPNSDIPPYWNSSFQGTVSTVNGNTWPVLEVEPRRYRFRILDMDNFRVPQLKIVRDPIARPGQIAVPTWVIGADGGLLPQAQPLHETNRAILMVTTERVDLIVDFTGEAVGNELFLINDGVTGDSSTPLNDVNNIGQIMKFKVVPLQGQDTTLPPDQLPLPARRNLGDPTETHRVSMNVIESQFTKGEQKRFQMGRVDPDGTNHLELWSDPISQVVTNGSTALWEVWNMPGVGGGHAFHIHLVEFQITERERLD